LGPKINIVHQYLTTKSKSRNIDYSSLLRVGVDRLGGIGATATATLLIVLMEEKPLAGPASVPTD
jgi:hypothetical protein